MAAFYHTYEFVGDQTFGIVRPHDRLISVLSPPPDADAASVRLGGASEARKPPSPKKAHAPSNSALAGGTRVVDASLLPMLSVPKPWLSIRNGGYVVTPVSLMRCGDDAFQHLALLSAVRRRAPPRLPWLP